MARRSILAGFITVLAAFAPLAANAATGIGSLRICSGCAAASGDLARYDYVILHASEHARIPALKAANPRLRALVYKNAAAAVSYMTSGGRDLPNLTAGVGYVDANANHPEWFLLDTAGRRIEFADYSGLWMMDIGNAAYQRAWLANVSADLRAHGWDGVIIDDINVSARWHLDERTIAKYPTDREYAGATRSFLARVGPALKSQGFLVLPNIYTEWPTGHHVWRDWITFASGAVQEYWTKWGRGTAQHFGGEDWTYRQQFLPLTEEAGKIYLGITYAPNDDARSMRYARASFLLDWDGGASALVFDTMAAGDPWAFDWTTDIGRPAEARLKVKGSVWRRDYTAGAALVNTSKTATQTVELGSSYLTPEGVPVMRLTLEPMTGIVLHFAPGAAPPPKAGPARKSKARRAVERFRRFETPV